MSDLQQLGLIVVAAYFGTTLWSRAHFVAQSSLQALRGRIQELLATARLRGATDDDEICKLLANVASEIEAAGRWTNRLRSTGATENRGWITAHYCERLLLSLPGYDEDYVYARLRREAAELSSLPPAEANTWRTLIARHIDAQGNRTANSVKGEAEADLSQLLARSNRVGDNYHISLAELYNKASWLILAGLLFIVATIAALPEAVPLLGVGAIGGLASRILRVSAAPSMPSDYGALWAPLFLAPVLGALLGWAGVLVMQLGKAVDLIALDGIDLADSRSPSVLGIALMFGFTERFFNGVANLVADKVFGGPAGAAQGSAGATEPASSSTTAPVATRGSDGANVPVVGAGGPGAADKVQANATGGPVVEAVRPVVEATSTRGRGTSGAPLPRASTAATAGGDTSGHQVAGSQGDMG